MLRTLKRCPTSIRWRIASTAAKSNPLSLSAASTSRLSSSQNTPNLFTTIRTLYQSSHKSQGAQAAAIEADVENQAQGSRPPNNKQIDDAVAMGPATRFAQLEERNLVDKVIVRTLTQTMGLEIMTQVQSLTIAEALKGKDVLAQAKTGTGKTIGFLLPVTQRILLEDPSLAERGRRAKPSRFGDRASDVRAIVISPTRELAEQIAAEAKKIIQNTSLVVQTAVGGTQKSMHLRAMQREGCHILVGTPGRLKDILSDRDTGVEAPKLSALVLDEADRLLDQGFWPEIQAIQDLLPTRQEKDRQTLMYSATVPQDVVKLVRTIMKPDLHYVRTVQDTEEPTHENVKQMLVTVPGFENFLPTLLELCHREINAATSKRPFKAIVYFNATAETTLASSIFFNVRRAANDSSMTFFPDTRIFEIHSRLTQRQRTAAAENFRNTPSAILMSSDVTARGMDFPGVTHVIQIGVPNERATYIHRVGRTARAGREGEGWLIVADGILPEARHRLGKLPLRTDTSLTAASVDYSTDIAGEGPANATPEAKTYFDAVARGARNLEPEEFEKSYMAMLGTFQWIRDKNWLISSMNRLTKVAWGMERPPSVSRQLAAKLGMLGVPGINFGGGSRGQFHTEESRGGGRSGGGDRGARGGFGGRGDSSSFSSDRPSYGDRSEARKRPFRQHYGDRNDRRPEREAAGAVGAVGKKLGFGGDRANLRGGGSSPRTKRF